MSKSKTIGYIRVSTIDQKGDRQLEGYCCDKLFIDQASGKDRKRPHLEEMVKYVREGDTLLCHSMDRLGRNLDDLRYLVDELTSKGVKIQFVKENLTFTGDDSPIAHLMLSVMGAVAEFERSLIRERQKEGIALAKKRGAFKGRKPKLSLQQVEALKRRVESGEPKDQISRDFNMSRSTLYNYLSVHQKHKGDVHVS